MSGAMWFTFDNYRFVRAAETAPGVVVAFHRQRGVRGSTRDHPVVRYRDPESGAVVEFESRFGVWPSPFTVGDDVTVAIRKDPARIEIYSFWSLWFLPLLLALFGIACALADRSILIGLVPE